MKPLFISLYIIFAGHYLIAQNTILYSPEMAGDYIITDVHEINDTLYTLHVDISTDYISELVLIQMNSGSIINSYKLGDSSFLASRIIKINRDTVYLLGSLKAGSCQSIVVSACFNLKTKELIILSEINFCNATVQNLRLTLDLENNWLVNGYWVDNGYRRFVLKMTKAYELSLILDSIISKMVTIDFSRKGYVLKDESFCRFFDNNFNFRKERYNIIEGIHNLHQTHMPYGDHYILESFSGSPNFENEGHYVRIIDSNLHVVKQLYFSPDSENLTGSSESPFFGGIDYIDNFAFWIAGNNNLSSDFQTPTHFSISSVDENLHVKCSKFIGYDAHYRVFGIRATADSGVVVFGMKYNNGYDPYLIKLGPNCELPTTSTIDSDWPLLSISAYPNPGINEISFSVQGFDPSALRVEFIDLPGQVVFAATDLSNRVVVADLPPGQYFYRILQGDRLLGTGGWTKQ